MVLIACDTDFLIKIANDPLPKFDWVSYSRQNDFCTLPCIVRELANLRSNRSIIISRRASTALSIIGKQPLAKIKELPSKPANAWSLSEANADDALIEFGNLDPFGRAVATLDGKLLSRLDSDGVPYLTLSSDRPLFVNRGAMHLSRKRRVLS
jgi:rRNA-processing protein FCF1